MRRCGLQCNQWPFFCISTNTKYCIGHMWQIIILYSTLLYYACTEWVSSPQLCGDNLASLFMAKASNASTWYLHAKNSWRNIFGKGPCSVLQYRTSVIRSSHSTQVFLHQLNFPPEPLGGFGLGLPLSDGALQWEPLIHGLRRERERP